MQMSEKYQIKDCTLWPKLLAECKERISSYNVSLFYSEKIKDLVENAVVTSVELEPRKEVIITTVKNVQIFIDFEDEEKFVTICSLPHILAKYFNSVTTSKTSVISVVDPMDLGTIAIKNNTTLTLSNSLGVISTDIYEGDIIEIKGDIDAKADKTELNVLRTEFNTLAEQISLLEKKVKNFREEKNKMKEEKNMKNFHFDFGPCTDDQVHVSMYGIAVKNRAGSYVSFDPATKQIVDVDIMNFTGAKYVYKMPSAIKDIKAGDVVIHNRVPMIVVEIPESTNNTLICVDVINGEEKRVIPSMSPFGFNFITKLVSLFNFATSNASTDNPFGNMLPFFMMSEDSDIDPMMLMMLGGGKFDMSNPMVMFALMGDHKDTKNLMPLFLMSQMNK